MDAVPLHQKGNTTVWVDDSTGRVYVKLYNTIVVEYDPSTGWIRLDTGGYATTTTKQRMNQFAEEQDLPYNVYQEDYQWYVSLLDQDVTIPFSRDVEFYV